MKRLKMVTTSLFNGNFLFLSLTNIWLNLNISDPYYGIFKILLATLFLGTSRLAHISEDRKTLLTHMGLTCIVISSPCKYKKPRQELSQLRDLSCKTVPVHNMGLIVPYRFPKLDQRVRLLEFGRKE